MVENPSIGKRLDTSKSAIKVKKVLIFDFEAL
jgi:hypothetical protein